MLDTWYPEPRLGTAAPAGGRDALLGENEAPHELAAAAGRDERRGVRSVVVLTVIGSLAEPPADAYDAYLRLHLLSHRLVAPARREPRRGLRRARQRRLDEPRPGRPAALPAVRLRFRASGDPFAVPRSTSSRA